MLLALVQNVGWSISDIAIAIIIIGAIIAVVYVGLRKMGTPIPDWVIQIFWILVVAVVCILAIRFLSGL